MLLNLPTTLNIPQVEKTSLEIFFKSSLKISHYWAVCQCQLWWRRIYLSVVIEALCCSEAGKHDPIVFEHVFKKTYSRLLQVVQHGEVGGYKIKAGNVNERFFLSVFCEFGELACNTHAHVRWGLCPTSSVPDDSFHEPQLLCRQKTTELMTLVVFFSVHRCNMLVLCVCVETGCFAGFWLSHLWMYLNRPPPRQRTELLLGTCSTPHHELKTQMLNLVWKTWLLSEQYQ